MKLQENEKIIKVFHHHHFFFFVRGLRVWGASLPFFMLAYLFSPIMTTMMVWTVFSSIIVLFALVHLYDFLMYYLDTLVITNQRVVHLDWINPFKYSEIEAALNDIQNIESEESGFLSNFSFFDFGNFLVETASTRTVIAFPEAPDPEGIKFFVTNLARKHVALANRVLLEKSPAGDAYQIQNKTESKKNKVASLD